MALGKAKRAVFFSIFRKVIIVAPLTWLLPQIAGLGTKGVFAAEPISNLIGGLACFLTMLATVMPELKEKENGEQQVGQLVKELKRLITGKRVGRLSVQERLVRQTCVMAFSKELKKYKDTVDCGEGMAKLLLWTYWEDLYDYWKIRSGGLARI